MNILEVLNFKPINVDILQNVSHQFNRYYNDRVCARAIFPQKLYFKFACGDVAVTQTVLFACFLERNLSRIVKLMFTNVGNLANWAQ